MFHYSFICPFCQERILTREAPFFCNYCKKTIARKPSLLETCGLSNSPQGVKCPTCEHVSAQRKCPDCGAMLPDNIDSVSLSIAIVGSQGSGKSHYIAMLIHWLHLHRDFRLRALNDETIRRYAQDFHDPLFKYRSVIQKTQRSTGLQRPLLYKLECGKSSRGVLLAFYDTAGEDVEDPRSMSVVNRYIQNASGIICLLDPLQLTNVRAALSNVVDEKTLPKQNPGAAKIVQNVTTLIISQTRRVDIPIPLAVTVSKIDALEHSDFPSPLLLSQDNRLFSQSRHGSKFDTEDFMETSDYMSQWVNNADSSIRDVCNNYRQVGFFGMSALGRETLNQTIPQNTGNRNTPVPQQLLRQPVSLRIEDPFLWILRKNHLISGQ